MIGTSTWGIVFIILGILILIKAFFGIDIPIFRVVFALLLLYAGISLLLKPPHTRWRITQWNSGNRHSQQVIFSKRNFKKEELSENYQIIFGQGVIDLRNTHIDTPTNIDINVNFGSGTLKLNPNVPTEITANASFGKIEFPDDTQISMGSYIYRTHPDDIDPEFNIRVNVTFGNLEIENN